MRSTIRTRTVELTVGLTIGSIAVIFAVVGGVIPASWLPRTDVVEVLPHVNAILSTFALLAIGSGIRAIRRGRIDAHRRRMGIAFALFVAFLVSYLYRLTVVGTKSFGGPPALEPVYLLVLAIHVTLAIVCLPLLYYVLLLATGYDQRELSETAHPRVGRFAATLWAVSFALGLVVYAALYAVPW